MSRVSLTGLLIGKTVRHGIKYIFKRMYVVEGNTNSISSISIIIRT